VRKKKEEGWTRFGEVLTEKGVVVGKGGGFRDERRGVHVCVSVCVHLN